MVVRLAAMRRARSRMVAAGISQIAAAHSASLARPSAAPVR